MTRGMQGGRLWVFHLRVIGVEVHPRAFRVFVSVPSELIDDGSTARVYEGIRVCVTASPLKRGGRSELVMTLALA
jgi:hypothetical protein